ncbi:hypothetical protein [Paraconexibacter sp.]|uniref:hypothetical protein n=1 Tax=Paraconexibacter sp. TaxID=2949640 RepID=UPI00356A4801
MALASLGASSATAQGVDTTCTLALTKTDPATVNVAYPDEAAIYWVGAYQGVPGTRLRITGRYPHARYFSFNVYDNAVRPIDAIADVEIQPDAGSMNPFVDGASRTAENRDYTAFIDFGPIPEQRAPNTIYTGTGQTGPNFSGTFILRTYIPDKGLDETGGVGLPTITLESTAVDGGRPSDSACKGLAKPPVPGVAQALADGAFPFQPKGLDAPGQPTPKWIKFRNLVQVYNRVVTDNPFFDSATEPLETAEQAGGNGGFLSNIHNSYVYAMLNRSYGEVSITRMKVPSTPDTRGGVATMPTAPLRYLSMCTNEIASQRFYACATDDQTTVGADGFAEYVVSTKASRPAWATSDCGFTWLPFGSATENVLVLRHMLPSAAFPEAIQRAEIGKEVATMGDYFPATRYLKDGEQPACRATRQSTGPSLGLPPSTKPGRCTSRRSFTIRLNRRFRSATVTVAGKRVKTRRGKRLRAKIVLKGLPKGTYRVRIVGRDRKGRKITTVRTYRTCVKQAASSKRGSKGARA